MKVVFLDCWTKGRHMFLPISKHLESRGMRSLLIHYGSWGDEPGRPEEESFDGLLCRDITYYRTRFLHEVLRSERPDCVVTLTTNNLIDRAKILSARALGIPSVFLMHGIVAASDAAIVGQMHVLKTTLRRKRFSRIPKYLSYVLPNYFLSGTAARSTYLLTRHPYQVLFNTFRYPEKWKQYPAPSQELQCEKCLVWGHAYKNFMAKTYGYSPDSISVVGHPPLDRACQILASPPSVDAVDAVKVAHGIAPEQRLVLYIEGAFAFSGYRGWTNETLRAHLAEMADLTAAAGRHLVVKLHPSTGGSSEIRQALRGRATVLRDAEAETWIWLSESVVGHSSTLINSAIVLDKPVFIPRWGVSGVIPATFDGVAPVSVCSAPEELRRGLANPDVVRHRNTSLRQQYLRDYLEPLDARSQHRIGQAIEQLVATRATQGGYKQAA